MQSWNDMSDRFQFGPVQKDLSRRKSTDEIWFYGWRIDSYHNVREGREATGDSQLETNSGWNKQLEERAENCQTFLTSRQGVIIKLICIAKFPS